MGNTPVWIMFGVSGLIGLGLYIWYLAALSRLFPKLGLPAGEGWIPVWNDWRLLQRADLPGWLVLAFLIPGLSIIGYIVRLIAYHRLTTEAQGSVGFTVAGAFIPALWATLLNGHMSRSGGGVKRQTSGFSEFAPPAQQPGGFAQQPGAYGQQPTGFAPQAPQQPFAAPVQPAAPAQPAGAQFAQPMPAQQPVQAQAQPQQPFAPPTPAQPAPAPAQDPWAVPQAAPAVPAAPEPTGFEALLAGGEQPSAPEAAQPAPRHAAPEQPAAPQFDSPLGSDTEREYARLAAEGLQAPPASRLEPQAPPQPFSWPGAEAQQPAATPEAPAAPQPVPPAPVAAPVPPVVPLTPEPAAAAPAAAAPAAAAPAEQGPLETGLLNTDSESAYTTRRVRRPEPEAPAASASSVPAEVEQTDDELDRTVVVARKPRIDWVLELPDGERLPLRDEQIIIGRKPRGPEGMALLTIPDPTRTLSKSHARLRYDGDMWSIEDLGSTNGLVLLFDDDTEEDVTPHSEVLATERMVIGTLEVRLIRNGDA